MLDELIELYGKYSNQHSAICKLYFELKDIEDTDDREIRESAVYLLLNKEKNLLEDFMYEIEQIMKLHKDKKTDKQK